MGQNAANNQLAGNTVRDNRKDGITFYSDATGNTLRDNIVSGNARYGIYVKSSNNLIDAGNQIFGNAIGVYLNTTPAPAVSLDTNRIYDNRDANVRVGGTRVTLDALVAAFTGGATAEEIVQRYPSLDRKKCASAIC